MPAIIEKLRADTGGAYNRPLRPLRALAARLTASAVIQTLDALGVQVPYQIRAAGSSLSREDLLAGSFTVTVAEIDRALAASGLGISDRLRFKYSLENMGVLV
jgi:hypothetical protein